jgi:hypothetical protein
MNAWFKQFLVACDLQGNLLPTGTIVCLLGLWCECDDRVVESYRRRKGRPPVVTVHKRQLAASIGQSIDAVDRHIRRLRSQRWIALSDASGNGQLIVLLLGAIDRTRVIARGEMTPLDDLLEGSLRTDCRISPDGLPDLSGRIAGSLPDPISIGLINNTTLPPNPPHGRAGALDEFEAQAIEILRGAITPAGCAEIPPNRHGARHLAERLREGYDPSRLRALVAAMPAIIAKRLRTPDRYLPSAFRGEVLDYWMSALAEHERQERASDALVDQVVNEAPENAPAGLADLGEFGRLAAQFGGTP